MSKLGVIAGAGGLPAEIVRACRAAERPVFVVRLAGMADADFGDADTVETGVAEWGKMMGALRKAGCRQICFAGAVPRPDFANLRPDFRGLASLPAVVAAARKGDDALLRQIMAEFERDGFAVENPSDVLSGLTIGEGALGQVSPGPAHVADIDKAIQAARALGALDIGQGVVVAGGLVLAVEAQEGTDAMLRRCAQLPRALRGVGSAPAGVLAKAVKPIQDRRIDLPTIGPQTVMGAAQAGLAGVVGEAGALLVVDRAEVIRTADELGLFVFGVPPA